MMKRQSRALQTVIIALLLNLCLGTSPAWAQNFAWSTGAGSTGYDNPWGIAADSAGNTYVTGTFQGTVAFGPGLGQTLTAPGNWNIFIAKYDINGALVWVRQTGGFTYGADIAVDAAGNVYVTGSILGTVSFGSGISLAVPLGSSALFVAKYDNSGVALWAQQSAGTGIANGQSIAVDGAGNSYVTGLFVGTVSFGSTSLSANGPSDILVAKYDTNGGSPIWIKQAGGPGQDVGTGIAVHESGTLTTVHVTGTFQGTAATFPGVPPIDSAGTDIFVAKLDSGSGTISWAIPASNSGYSEESGRIAVDSMGSSYVTGNLGNAPVFPFQQLFLAKFDSNGIPQWTRGAFGSINAYGIAIDPFDNVHVSTSFGGGLTFLSMSIPPTPVLSLTSGGYLDLLIVRYDPAGNFLSHSQASGVINVINFPSGIPPADIAIGTGVAVDAQGSARVAGYFRGTLRFDPAVPPLTSAGNDEIFVARYGPLPPPAPPVGHTTVGLNQKVTLPAVGGGPLGVELTFDNVTSPGVTTATLVPAGAVPPPSGFFLGAAFLSIDTTATFTGNVHIAIQYDPVALGLSPAAEAALKLWHYHCDQSGCHGSFIINAAVTPNPDTVNHIIYGVINSFSLFTLLLPEGLIALDVPTLTQTYDGNPRFVFADTTPPGLDFVVTYNGLYTPPTNAGTYQVLATIADPLYTGSVSGTLVINRAPATVTLSAAGLTQNHDGTPKSVAVTTIPAGLPTTVVYKQNGAVVTAPTNAGTYDVSATVTDANYQGSATGILVIRDVAAPNVTAPASITIPATEAVGARAINFAALAAYLAGGSATDLADPTPVRLIPQISGVDVLNSTLLPMGTTTVTFRFRDASGNIGSATSSVTIILGRPSLTGALAGQGADSSGFYVDVRWTNNGNGNARGIVVSQLVLRTLGGTGTVSYNTTASAPLPRAVGDLNASASIVLRFYLTRPATVTRFSITESGNLRDVAGTNFNFSIGQAVIP